MNNNIMINNNIPNTDAYYVWRNNISIKHNIIITGIWYTHKRHLPIPILCKHRWRKPRGPTGRRRDYIIHIYIRVYRYLSNITSNTTSN